MEANANEIPEWLEKSMAADARHAEGVRKEQDILSRKIAERIKPIALDAIIPEACWVDCHADRKMKESVSIFCTKIWQRMLAYKRRLDTRPSNAKIVENIERINNILDDTIRELRSVSCFQYYLSDIYGTIDRMGGEDWDEDLFTEMPPKANQARNKLLEVKELLEQQKKKFPIKRGRAGADEQGFVTAICFAYDEYIGEPTGYEEGPFFNIVTIALDIMGRPSMDPSRSIEKALTALRTRQTSLTKSQE